MSYKKLVSLFAVSTLALAACGTEDTEEPATDDAEQTEQTEETDTSEEGSSTEDLINQAQENSGEASPEYGLEIDGTWSEEGYIIQHAPGEAATIPVVITSEQSEYNTYLLEDGVIAEVVSNEPEPTFTIESPSADTDYVVGVSPDDLGEVGDEVAVEDLYRYENIVFEEAEPTAEDEE